MYTTLISVPALQALMVGDQACMVFDCSFDLGNTAAGQQQHEQARIPGAVRADLDLHLSQHTDRTSAQSGGRHPLPSRENFARWLNAVGFGNHMQAVVYDRQGAHYCGRLWWMLKWCGHQAVAVLDGGWPAWVAGGGAVQSGPASACNASASATGTGFVLQDPLAERVESAQLLQRLGAPDLTVLDARAAARFRGETEPLDPVAGHIPGALNRPFNANFAADGRFKNAAELRTEFERVLAGRDPATVVHQCGSGVTAAANLLAMEIAGLGRQPLYAGSWSDWCNTPGLPCAQG